jgi:hypothetical protein
MQRSEFFGCASLVSAAALAEPAAAQTPARGVKIVHAGRLESMVACCMDGCRPVFSELKRVA